MLNIVPRFLFAALALSFQLIASSGSWTPGEVPVSWVVDPPLGLPQGTSFFEMGRVMVDPHATLTIRRARWDNFEVPPLSESTLGSYVKRLELRISFPELVLAKPNLAPWTQGDGGRLFLWLPKDPSAVALPDFAGSVQVQKNLDWLEKEARRRIAPNLYFR